MPAGNNPNMKVVFVKGGPGPGRWPVPAQVESMLQKASALVPHSCGQGQPADSKQMSRFHSMHREHVTRRQCHAFANGTLRTSLLVLQQKQSKTEGCWDRSLPAVEVHTSWCQPTLHTLHCCSQQCFVVSAAWCPSLPRHTLTRQSKTEGCWDQSLPAVEEHTSWCQPTLHCCSQQCFVVSNTLLANTRVFGCQTSHLVHVVAKACARKEHPFLHC